MTSPPFIAALTALVLNDFVLKDLFHNWWTGKLSDFAGLFVFPLFLTAWVPRFRASIYFSTAAMFVFWKSAYSQWPIDTVNATLPISIGRTSDLTDLIALCALPASWLYTSSALPGNACTFRLIGALAVSAFCIFAFAATTTVPPEHIIRYDKVYPFDFSREELVRRIEELSLVRLPMPRDGRSGQDATDVYFAMLDDDICISDGGRILMEASSRPLNGSALLLRTISYNCDSRISGDQQRLLEEFERRVVNPLLPR